MIFQYSFLNTSLLYDFVFFWPATEQFFCKLSPRMLKLFHWRAFKNLNNSKSQNMFFGISLCQHQYSFEAVLNHVTVLVNFLEKWPLFSMFVFLSRLFTVWKYFPLSLLGKDYFRSQLEISWSLFIYFLCFCQLCFCQNVPITFLVDVKNSLSC